MLIKKVTYTNFLGEERTKRLYFHISATDAVRMVMKESSIDGGLDPDAAMAMEDVDIKDVKDGLSERIRGVMSRGKGSEILGLFDWLVENAYGEISEDGETFVKSPEIFAEWQNTASYDHFFTELMSDTDLLVEFTNGIFPKELAQNLPKGDPEFKSHRKAQQKN